MTKKATKPRKVKSPSVPTFGWLEAYKEKRDERTPAREARAIERFEALLDK